MSDKSDAALKGAATGAAMGAPFGGVGAAVGAGLGGLYGYFSGGSSGSSVAKAPASAKYQTSYLQHYLGRQAPGMNTAAADQYRAQQSQLAQMLFRTANGQQAGAGELAVGRGVNNAMAQQTSMAQMARGADSALAGRNAARANADIGVNGAGQAGIARMQDQSNAQSQLSQLLGMARGQDLQTAQANQGAQMQQQNLQLGALAQLLGVDQATLGQGNTQAAMDAANRARQDAYNGAMLQAAGNGLSTYYTNQNNTNNANKTT